jgi:hypothetical protein
MLHPAPPAGRYSAPLGHRREAADLMIAVGFVQVREMLPATLRSLLDRMRG